LLDNYQSLADLALAEFEDIVTRTAFIGGTPVSPNKLRLVLIDDSVLDIWLSVEGDYAYHWEQRLQHGQFHRWDNAPHHPRVASYPAHFHDSDENTVPESDLDPSPQAALRQVLNFVRRRLS
jgi:hypothetical protein